MKILLNKNGSKDWDAVVAYFGRVCDEIQLVEVEARSSNHSILQRVLYLAESRFSAPIVDCVSPYENRVEADTTNIVLNLSSIKYDEIIVNHPKSEIWSIEYLGRSIADFDGEGVGIKEICRNEDTIKVDVVKYKTEDGEKIIVDSCWYNPHYSAYRNFQKVLVSASRVFVRCLKINTQRSTHASESESIHIGERIKYFINFVGNIIEKYGVVLSNAFLGYYDERWTVAIGEGSYLRNGRESLTVHPMPNKEFWADPFVFEKDGKSFLFFERYPFNKKKGVLSVAEINNKKFVNDRDIIEQPYHLSYPNVFEEDGEVYMIPECSANNKIEIYRCIEFPDKWELFSSGLDGASLVDTCYYRDENGKRWLFSSRSWNGIDTHCEALEIYQIDSLKLNHIVPHRMNPICVDSRKGRNGGRIYVEDGCSYRVSQDNRFGKYGHGVSLYKIDSLTIENYSEHQKAMFLGCDVKGFTGTHQLCQGEKSFVIDLRK